MTGNQQPLSLAKWTIFTFIGWFTGIVFMVVLSGFLDSIGIEKFQFYVGLGIGTGVGFFQWLVLKKSGVTMQWMWSAVLGLGIPFLLLDIISLYAIPLGSAYLPISVVSGAILTSIFQFRILKKYSTNAARWLLGSVGAWVLASAVVLSIDYTKYLTQNNWVGFALNLTLILGGGVVLGLVSGKVLNAILKNNSESIMSFPGSPKIQKQQP
jgi:hypothetical protein